MEPVTTVRSLPGTQQARPTEDIDYFEAHPELYYMEPKYDGFRMLAEYDPNRELGTWFWEGWSRGHNVVGRKKGSSDPAGLHRMLPHVHQALIHLKGVTDYTVLDGELYVAGEGGTHTRNHSHVASVIKSLPARARSLQGVTPEGELDPMGGGTPLTYFAFDVLFLNGVDLRAKGWESRRRVLEALLMKPERWPDWPWDEESPVQLSPILPPSQLALDRMLARGVEGCIVKRRDRPYQSWDRPKDNWYKYKVDQTADVVCMGFTAGREGKGVRNMPDTFGAIIFGQYQETDEGLALVERGRASGMDDSLRFGYLDKSRGIDRTSELLGRVFEIRHNGIQNPGFRHPRFLWWRDDKRPEDCTWD